MISSPPGWPSNAKPRFHPDGGHSSLDTLVLKKLMFVSSPGQALVHMYPHISTVGLRYRVPEGEGLDSKRVLAS